MSTIFEKARRDAKKNNKPAPQTRFVHTEYKSKPVSVPSTFLSPLADPSTITVNQIDFANSALPEYKGLYAVVLDNVLSHAECAELIHMAELSAGGHVGDAAVENDGWQVAMVNAGRNIEVLATDYRNSDRIIWDSEDMVQRIWKRVVQAKGMQEYFTLLAGKEYEPVVGDSLNKWDEKWRISPKGPNERMRFLKYGKGQFFRPHCDGMYETPDGEERSFFTLHLYLNDSAQALGIPKPLFRDSKDEKTGEELLRGGATTFHSRDMNRRIDVDPLAGRVLIFQQRRLYHSGDDVTAGIKYTMRSDLMYGVEIPEPDGTERFKFDVDSDDAWDMMETDEQGK